MVETLILLAKVAGSAFIGLLTVYLIVRLSTYAYFKSKRDAETLKRGGN